MPRSNSDPLISIIIVHYNHKELLETCLSGLLEQTYPHFEIILVDNGSTDGSVPYVNKHFPSVTIIKNKTNVGFAEGNNIGVENAKGEYFLLLNNDTVVEKDFLEKFIGGFSINDKVGILQSKLILTEDRGLDTCGAYWTDSSFLYYIGNYKDPNLEIYNRPFPVFTCKGASMMIKREVIEKIGLFDNDFWSYYEETDFCHRAWVAGWETWYWPEAECIHAMGSTSLTLFNRDYVQFHNFKNKLCSFIKNLSWIELIKVIPVFLILNMFIAVIWIIQGKWRSAQALLKAILWNIAHLTQTLQKRKIVQAKRVLTDSQIWDKVKKNPRLSYYYYLFNDNFVKYKDSYE